MNRILSALHQHAQQKPDSIAFIGHNAKQEKIALSYQQLLEKVEDTARTLRQWQVQRIALKAENSLDWVIIDLAAMHAKIVLVPVPTFFSKAQVEHLLYESGVDVCLGDWPTLGEPFSTLSHLPAFVYLANPSAQVLPLTQKITFTSGSTGTPKGVCLSDENMQAVTLAIAEKMSAQVERHLVMLPLSTLLENITGVYVPLVLGVTSTVVCGSEVGLTGSSQFCGATFALALQQFQPSSLVLTPALLLALIEVVKQSPALALPLRWVAVGGARVAPQLIDAARQLGIPAFEGYGLSESASVVSMNTPQQNKPGSCGQVLSHLQVSLAQDGELLVKGNTSLGYLGEPFSHEWLSTGDMATIDDEGFLTIIGRKKNLIITSFGRNVAPEWIESQALALIAHHRFVVVGDGQAGLTAVSDSPLPDLVTRVQQLNSVLPDYAHITQLWLVSDTHCWQKWLTANGRPKRLAIENALQEARLARHTTNPQTVFISIPSFYSMAEEL
ncbi:AMP-binding protein [Vibrio anguillarum]|uniref:AMP-binding protein n=1 Tax=Vibrio anguillarum TaxID=55601 RepID=UPI001C9D1682|nr:AMP-binding protein [Vibrio anguillarum]MBY7666389.1 AMP-binding protein [Vibrio anguillarum]